MIKLTLLKVAISVVTVGLRDKKNPGLLPWLQSFPPYPRGQSQEKVSQLTLQVPPF